MATKTPSERWTLRDPKKMPPKGEMPEDVRDLPLEGRKRWWLTYLRFTDCPADYPSDDELTPQQLANRDVQLAAWRAWQRTGDNQYLKDAGLISDTEPPDRS